jgi:flagellar biosynthetic protein FliQ
MEGQAAVAIHDAVIVMAKICGPVLVAALVVGMVMSIIQAVTQINESTLAFIPKVAVIFATLLFLGPFFTRVLTTFTNGLFDQIISIGGS